MQCTAKSKRTGERCCKQAMHGKKVCYMHGGKSKGAAKGEKRALKTGAHETILESTMSEEEREYARSLKTDPLEVLLESLRVLKVRELRVMQRIKGLRDAEAVAGQPTGEQDEHGRPRRYPVLLAREGTQTAYSGPNGSGNSATTSNESFAQAIQRWEKGLTEIQDQIRRTMESIARLPPDRGEGAGGVEIVMNFGAGRHGATGGKP